MELSALNVLFQGTNTLRLLEGLWLALQVGGISIILSLILGTFFGIFMTWKNPVARVISVVHTEIVSLLPQLALLYVVFFGATQILGVDLTAEFSSILVFTFCGTGEMGSLVRGAIKSIPPTQERSSVALGFTKAQTFRYILLPQALRSIIPSAMNFITRMIKVTSVMMLIGVVEMMKVGQQIIDANRLNDPGCVFVVYGLIIFLYFIVCWPISLIAGHLEKKWK